MLCEDYYKLFKLITDRFKEIYTKISLLRVIFAFADATRVTIHADSLITRLSTILMVSPWEFGVIDCVFIQSNCRVSLGKTDMFVGLRKRLCWQDGFEGLRKWYA